MSLSSAESPQRMPSFNPAAPAFNPRQALNANAVTIASVETESAFTFTMPAPLTGAEMHQDSPALSYRQPYLGGIFLPKIDHPPLSDLSPMGGQSHGNAEELARNLGLPLFPSMRRQVQPSSAPSAQSGLSVNGPVIHQHHTLPTSPHRLNGRPSEPAHKTQQEKESDSPLFQQDQRTQGIDGKLVQQALRKTLTPEKLAQHLQNKLSFQRPSTGTPAQDGLENFLASFTHTQPQNFQPYQPSQASQPSQQSHQTGIVLPPHTTAGYNGGMQWDSQYGFFDPLAHYITQQQKKGQVQQQQKQHVQQHAQQQQHVLRVSTPPNAPQAMVNYPVQQYPQPQRNASGGAPLPDNRYTQVQQTPCNHNRNRRGSARFSTPRIKRSDQGPEASPADIYPEDAIFAANGPPPTFKVYKLPNNHTSMGEFQSGVKFSNQQLPMQLRLDLKAEDSTTWPTSAEALAPAKPSVPADKLPEWLRDRLTEKEHEKLKPTPTLPTNKNLVNPKGWISNLYKPRAKILPPTLAQVLCSTSPPLPSPHNDTHSSSSLNVANNSKQDKQTMNSVIPDARPLTPRQDDCSRYGLGCYGIGYMEAWNPRFTRGPGERTPFVHAEGEKWPVEHFRIRGID